MRVQGCCSEAEAQQAGRMQTTSQPIQCELPTIPVQIGSHFLKGVSFNESAADNLKLKTVTRHARFKESPRIVLDCVVFFIIGSVTSADTKYGLLLWMTLIVLSPQHTMLQLIKGALGQNGVTPRDDSPVTEVLNQVCPSSWRGACKTAVQLLFAQAGLVSRDVKEQCCCIRPVFSEYCC